MYLPALKPLATGSRLISKFTGLDLRNSLPEGAFRDMENLSGRNFPVLSVREKRGKIAETGPLGGMIAKDALCYVRGTEFVINGNAVNMDLSPGEKQLVSMGAYVVIFPDKKYINTGDTADRGSLEAFFEAVSDVQFALCDSRGTVLSNVHFDTTPPEKPASGAYWVDVSQNPCVLRRYSAAQESWSEEPVSYLRMSAQGIGTRFAPGDGVEISGIAAQAMKDLNGNTVLQAVGENYLVIPGVLPATATQSPDQGTVTVRRSVPRMDFVVEAGNRLWGCGYGFDGSGNFVNCLYACKLGDFKNWNCFEGLSTDSYCADLGADGHFTGAVTHLGYPMFFREGCFHKVYGNLPANYQIQTTACRGVSQGSAKSLAIVDGVLYYLSPGGVCAYDGSLPEVVSRKLGYLPFTQGVAGVRGSDYYISMVREGKRSLYVLDTVRNQWHREDGLEAKCFCTRGESLFCHDGEAIWDLSGTGTPEETLSWYACTGPLSAQDPHKRYITHITARLRLEPGTTVYFSARYDGEGDFVPLGTLRHTGLRSACVPLRTRRCESLELKISGTGEAKLFSLAIIQTQGSDGR